MNSNKNIIRTSGELWKTLLEQGGLQPETYDKRLILDLTEELCLDPTKPFYPQLTEVSPTKLLVALLSALQPWSTMLSDIMQMFERHGVHTSNSLLLIEFDFGPSNEKLQFDVNHFKRAQELQQALLASIQSVSSSDIELYELWRLIVVELATSHGIRVSNPRQVTEIARLDGVAYFSNNPPSAVNARQWFGYTLDQNGRDHNYWPFNDSLPLPLWKPGDPLAAAVNSLTTIIVMLRKRAVDYWSWEDVYFAYHRHPQDPALNTRKRDPIEKWSPKRTVAAIHDRMTQSLLNAVWLLYDLAPREASTRETLAQKVVSLVSERVSIQELNTPRPLLEELLALPVWRFRHQLYSAWQITAVERAAAPSTSFRLNTVFGSLRFSFKETIVATLSSGSEELELVAELRTPAPLDVQLQGKSRISSVQPDYLIRSTSTGEVRYVLEAKQYRAGSRSSFAKVLYDYAAVHLTALVAIANYGSMPIGMRQAVERLAHKTKMASKASLVDRCEAFGDVRPGETGLTQLQEHIRQILPAAVSPIVPLLVVDATSSMLSQLPENISTSKIWQVLLSWPGPVALIQDDALMPLESSSGYDIAETLRLKARPAELSFEVAAAALPDGCILITDIGGTNESQPFLSLFCAVVTLTDQGRECYYNLADDAPTFVAKILQEASAPTG